MRRISEGLEVSIREIGGNKEKEKIVRRGKNRV